MVKNLLKACCMIAALTAAGQAAAETFPLVNYLLNGPVYRRIYR